MRFRLILRQRSCDHEYEFLRREPCETYTGYCEQCRKCGRIVQVPQ